MEVKNEKSMRSDTDWEGEAPARAATIPSEWSRSRPDDAESSKGLDRLRARDAQIHDPNDDAWNDDDLHGRALSVKVHQIDDNQDRASALFFCLKFKVQSSKCRVVETMTTDGSSRE